MLYDTQNTKPSHLDRGFFSIGSGPQKVLILGSCRVLPYVNYLDQLNRDDRLTINLINVVNYNFGVEDKPVDSVQVVERLEQNAEMRNMLESVDVFLHEHTESYGMFNTSKSCEKNIYQFGVKPWANVSLPNFNDVHVLAQEMVNYDREFHDLVKADFDKSGGRLDNQWIGVFQKRGMAAIDKFLSICRLSGLPEFAALFERDWINRRYFWTGSHVSNIFTMEVFELINAKFLGLELPESFWDYARSNDPYAEPHTPITYIDAMAYGLKWPQKQERLAL